jgi:hypothetical protein
VVAGYDATAPKVYSIYVLSDWKKNRISLRKTLEHPKADEPTNSRIAGFGQHTAFDEWVKTGSRIQQKFIAKYSSS